MHALSKVQGVVNVHRRVLSDSRSDIELTLQDPSRDFAFPKGGSVCPAGFDLKSLGVTRGCSLDHSKPTYNDSWVTAYQ